MKTDEVRMADEINYLAAICHKANDKWWHNLKTGEPLDRNHGELFMLMVGEVAEAMEGERKNLQDSHLPEHKAAEVELIDALIRIFDYLGKHYPQTAGNAFVKKMQYNSVRKDHTTEERLKANGKRF